MKRVFNLELMKIGLSIVLLLITSLLFGQKADFKPIQSKGKIPHSILSLASVSYEKDRAKVDASKRIDKIRQDAFYLKQNYGISKLLKNGQIVFGDEVTEYVREIGNKILAEIPGLEGQIEFFVVKDPDVNAFSTQKGILFVNMGLIAQVENEAQLAFVLIHELTHYIEKHGVDGYVAKEAIRNNDRAYRELTLEQRKNKYTQYSQEHEFEADGKGLQDVYLKLGYDINEALNVFDVLLYSYLPFDEITFDTNYFNDEFFQLPVGCNMKKANPISAIEDYDDSRTSHPNIKNRRENIFQVVAEIDEVGKGVKFLLSESRFHKVRNLARYDLCQLYLDQQEFGKALYSSYILLRDDSNSLYLQTIRAYALYGYSKYYNERNGNSSITEETNTSRIVINGDEASEAGVIDMSKQEGLSSPMYYMIDKMGHRDLNIIALRCIFDALVDYPEDVFLKKIAKDCIYDLMTYHKLFADDFATEIFVDTATFNELSDKEYEALNKYDKIRYEKKKRSFKDKSELSYLNYAFMTYFKANANLVSLFGETKKVYDKKKSFYTKYKDYSVKEKEKIELEELDESEKVGIDKVLVINPMYASVSKGKYQYFRSENKENTFIRNMKETAVMAGVEIEVLDAYDFDNKDIEKLNDLAVIMRFYIEHFNHKEFSTDMHIVNSNLAYVDRLTEKYGTEYFTITSGKNYVQGRSNRIAVLLYTAYLVVPFPWGVYYALTNELDYMFYMETINATTGEVSFSTYKDAASRDHNYLMRSLFYDAFFTMKQPKKD